MPFQNDLQTAQWNEKKPSQFGTPIQKSNCRYRNSFSLLTILPLFSLRNFPKLDKNLSNMRIKKHATHLQSLLYIYMTESRTFLPTAFNRISERRGWSRFEMSRRFIHRTFPDQNFSSFFYHAVFILLYLRITYLTRVITILILSVYSPTNYKNFFKNSDLVH